MRLIHRPRSARRGKPPRIAISQAEITADLLYPAQPREAARRPEARWRGEGR
ncbi:MAG: hypothetical protein U0R71_06145 [Solirubrobacterales bacterium]